MRLLWIDTETTGTDPARHAVVEIAGMIEHEGRVVEEFELFCRPHPGAEIDDRALEIIGRTREEILGFPPAYEAYSKLIGMIQRYVPKYTKDVNQRFKIAGQNIGFDYEMMQAFWKNCGDRYWYASVDRRGIDVVLASALMRTAGRLDVQDLKLGTVCTALGIELEAHRAIHDIRAARQVWLTYAGMIRGEMTGPGVYRKDLFMCVVHGQMDGEKCIVCEGGVPA